MSKEKNVTTGEKKGMPAGLKTTLPVIIALVLILAITIVVSSVKSSSHRTPTISNANDVYLTLDDLKITNDRLYTYLKQSYGSAELLRLIDNQLYKEEIAKVDEANDAFIKYIYKSVFSVEELKDADSKTYQTTWETLIDTLIQNNLLSKADAATDNTYNSKNTTTTETSELAKATCSKAWVVVKSYYKMQYARNEWAKTAYLKEYQQGRTDNDKTGLFDDKDIATYYDENYTGSCTGLYIPFTSEKAALEMMKRYGINTDTNYVLTTNAKGWVNSSFDATKGTVTASDYLTNEQVMAKFVSMYNEVLGYYQTGDIIKTDSYTREFSKIKSAYAVKALLDTLMSDNDTLSTNLILPTVGKVAGYEDVSITWTMDASDYATFDGGNKITIGANAAFEELNLTAVLKYGTAEDAPTITTNYDVTIAKNAANDKDTTLTLTDAQPQFNYKFTDEFLANPGNEFSTFKWDKETSDAVNTELTKYLSATSTKLTLSDDVNTFYKSYTVKPVAMGNYYILAIKLTEEKPMELYTQDDDDNYTFSTTDEGKAIYNEIVEKKTEDLYTDNNLNEQIYQNRFNHTLKVYDPYLQAIYEYNYKYFYETTLKVTDYDAYKVTKKPKKNWVATIVLDDKSTFTITTDDLWKELESKYGVSQALNLINVYEVAGNKAYNTVYNPYTQEVYDEYTFNTLLSSEIASLRKNFELGYFTYSYLSYYGFIPNFPAKYGWKNFIKDYFGVESDEELLASNSFGGTVYSNALELFTKEVYENAGGKQLYWKYIDENSEKYYSVSAHNIVIGVDYNYDGKADTNELVDEETNERKDCNWTAEQRALAKELSAFLYSHAVDTGEQTLASQLTAIVKMYNEADMVYDETLYNEAVANNTSIYDFNYFAKFKQKNITVTLEATQSYTSSSSLVQEFVDEMLNVYNLLKTDDLLTATLDSPYVTDAFETSYGYHMVSILSGAAATDPVTQQDIDIYVANTAVTTAKTALEKTKENIKTNKEKGAAVDTYEAQLIIDTAELEKTVKELTAVLLKYKVVDENWVYGIDGYTIDEEITTRAEAWYKTAYESLTKSKELSKALVKATNQLITDGKIKFTTESNLDFLKIVLEVITKTNEKDE